MKVVLDNVTKIYHSKKRNDNSNVFAVNKFNYEFADGKLTALLGPSGCGKSTTLNLISGLEAPTDGRIFFGKEDVTDVEPQNRGIGFVFQNYALYPHLTVKQNILFPLQNLKKSNKISKYEMQSRVENIIKLVSLENLINRHPSELSGGQQQRVAIARALVKTPKILLLDEPLSNLDARLRLQTREEIRRIQQEIGITTIFVTHDQEEALSISDEIVVMNNGVIQQTGNPQCVYDNPCNQFVANFLGNPPINIFSGKIKNGNLFIGSQIISSDIRHQDGDVFVGIRPEGFIPDENGVMTCKIKRIESAGRDISILAHHDSLMSQNFRAIINSDCFVDQAKSEITFSIKQNKLFIFDYQTKNRIYGDLDE